MRWEAETVETVASRELFSIGLKPGVNERRCCHRQGETAWNRLAGRFFGSFAFAHLAERIRSLRVTGALRSWPRASRGGTTAAVSLLLAGTLWCCGLFAALPTELALPKERDCFFVENDLVYSRFLQFSRDGSYRQIDQGTEETKEVDRGTWEQAEGSSVRLHSTFRGLRFRALRSGPLTVVLDSGDKVAALPEMARGARRLLAESQDAVFAASTAAELGVPPAVVEVDRRAETFRRDELIALAAQMDDASESERTRTYVLLPLRLPDHPLLLIQRGATFPAEQAGEVCRTYRVRRGQAPPFYFAQTTAAAYANRVGRWQELALPVGLPNP